MRNTPVVCIKRKRNGFPLLSMTSIKPRRLALCLNRRLMWKINPVRRLNVFCEKRKSSGTKDLTPSSFWRETTIDDISKCLPMGGTWRSVLLSSNRMRADRGSSRAEALYLLILPVFVWGSRWRELHSWWDPNKWYSTSHGRREWYPHDTFLWRGGANCGVSNGT